MSGIEVVAAVAAVISAFHGGSELFKIVKDKRRTRKARDQAQLEWEEKQLQDSLASGEQQITLRWAQDTRELGEYMRVGDAIARERLNHIVIRFQAELIKSLELAAVHGTAPLNLRLLYQASIASKNDTFLTFDELKQRLYHSRQVPRPLLSGPIQGTQSRHSIASVQTIHTRDYDPSSSRIGSQSQRNAATESQHTGSLAEYFRSQRSKSTPSAPAPIQKPSETDYSEALAEFMRAKGLEVQQMQDMLENMDIRKSRNLSDPPYSQQLERRDTLTMLNNEGSYRTPITHLNHNGMSLQDPNLPRINYYDATSAQNDHAFDLSSYNAPREQVQPDSHRLSNVSYCHPQTQASLAPRWSDASASSSPYSDAASLNRNGSNSSHGSNSHVTPSTEYPLFYDNSRLSELSASPHAPYQPQMHISSVPQQQSHPPVAAVPSYPQHHKDQRYATSPTPMHQNELAASPVSPRNSMSSSSHNSWPGGPQEPLRHVYGPTSPPQPIFKQERSDSVPYAPNPRYSPPPAAPSNTNEHMGTPSGFAAVAAAASTLSNTPNLTARRHDSITPSIASTDSTGSATIGVLPGSRMRPRFSIRSDTIQSGPAGHEKMMDGRPDKHNNYWGFCKGAWAVREKVEKGIALRTIPSGYYNSKQVWECKECSFRGDVFTKPHPTKKNKTVEIVDTRIHTSASGIRYRWIFLAKCHVKKKAETAAHHGDECNYGCIFCSVEGNVTGIYGGVETLMNHIALVHVADMSDRTRQKTNCILGRTAGADEGFDVNVPIFAQMEELAG